MPLPNWGYHNKEAKKHQELKFQMAPEIVDVPIRDDNFGGIGESQSRKQGRVTTGKSSFSALFLFILLIL